MTVHAEETAATTRDFQARIDRARAEGLPIEVSIIEGDRESVWIVDADAVSVADGSMKLHVEDGTLEFAYSGPSALPVMPSLILVDRAHALRAQAIAVRDGVGRIDGTPAIMRFADARNEAVGTSDLMHVSSTGIYPPTLLGMDWSEVASVTAGMDGMTVVSKRDGSIGFTMSTPS